LQEKEGSKRTSPNAAFSSACSEEFDLAYAAALDRQIAKQEDSDYCRQFCSERTSCCINAVSCAVHLWLAAWSH